MCDSCNLFPELCNTFSGKEIHLYHIQFKNLNEKKTHVMGNLLYTVAVILIILWLIGMVGFHIGGFIHILLVIAIIAILVRVIQGRSL